MLFPLSLLLWFRIAKMVEHNKSKAGKPDIQNRTQLEETLFRIRKVAGAFAAKRSSVCRRSIVTSYSISAGSWFCKLFWRWQIEVQQISFSPLSVAATTKSSPDPNEMSFVCRLVGSLDFEVLKNCDSGKQVSWTIPAWFWSLAERPVGYARNRRHDGTMTQISRSRSLRGACGLKWTLFGVLQLFRHTCIFEKKKKKNNNKKQKQTKKKKPKSKFITIGKNKRSLSHFKRARKAWSFLLLLDKKSQ